MAIDAVPSHHCSHRTRGFRRPAVPAAAVTAPVMLMGLAVLACGSDASAPTTPPATERAAIVFARSPTDSVVFGGQIFAIRADGGGLQALTGTDHNVDPVWSPDGERIAFISYRTNFQEIYVMHADGTGVTRLTNDGTNDQAPTWSPDGRRIAFSSLHPAAGAAGSTAENFEIEVVDADGTGRARLTNSPGWDITPAWSPDGARIAFASARTGRLELYTMRADGADVRRVTSSSGTAGNGGFFPAWSPDGRRLAFATSRDGNQEIYVVNSDGTGEARLTNNPAQENQPAWSPDGTQLLFWSTRGGALPQLYVMNADGSSQRRLLTSTQADMSPSWRR